MHDEILNDNLSQNEEDNGYFILTKKSIQYLYSAAKWARITALILIVSAAFKFVLSILQLSAQPKNFYSNGIIDQIGSLLFLLETFVTIIVALYLYHFSSNFIKGYKLDNDDLIDNSFFNLSKFFKYAVISIGLVLIISVAFILYSEYFKSLILIPPIILLFIFYYQNSVLNSSKDNSEEIFTENK